MISGRLGAVAIGAGACLVMAGCGPALAADSLLVLEGPDRVPVGWAQWLEGRGPVAVLLWASWAPRADATVAQLDELSAACRSAGLELVVVAVQEPFADAEAVLGRRSVAWLHDRHGQLLKLYRVLQLPGLVVLEADGSLSARLEPTPEGVRGWSRR